MLVSVAACGSGDGGGGALGDSGYCSGKGWQGTCNWHSTCQNGHYWLYCQSNQNSTYATLEEMGYDLDGSSCLCVIERDGSVAVEREVSGTDEHCLDQFDTSTPGYHDQAIPIVERLCGWDLGY
jgi:hypothetical protein